MASFFGSLSVPTVQLDDAAVFEMMNSLDGPVGRYLLDLSEQAAEVARTVVPVRKRTRRSPKSTSRPSGFTKRSIRTDMYWDDQGLIYGGVAADFAMTIFLETPAKQMHRAYPFLSTALESLDI